MSKSQRFGDQDFISIGGQCLPLPTLWNHALFDDKGRDGLLKSFTEADPYPHLVIDNLFSEDLLDLVEQEFSLLSNKVWRRAKSANDSYYRSQYGSELGAASNLYFSQVNSGEFVRFLSDITGISPLIPDPTLLGGGLHESKTGDWFGIHTDFSNHTKTHLPNKFVLITYLNREWVEDFGGSLELWSAEKRACVRKIVPVFGRTVILAHGKTSLHGHTDPVRAPGGRSRRSIAAYFYGSETDQLTAGRGSVVYGTDFLDRKTKPSSGALDFVRQLSPPILVTAAKAIKARAMPVDRWDEPPSRKKDPARRSKKNYE